MMADEKPPPQTITLGTAHFNVAAPDEAIAPDPTPLPPGDDPIDPDAPTCPKCGSPDPWLRLPVAHLLFGPCDSGWHNRPEFV